MSLYIYQHPRGGGMVPLGHNQKLRPSARPHMPVNITRDQGWAQLGDFLLGVGAKTRLTHDTEGKPARVLFRDRWVG